MSPSRPSQRTHAARKRRQSAALAPPAVSSDRVARPGAGRDRLPRAATGRPSGAPSTSAGRWPLAFLRNVLLWLLPAAALWSLLTPFYNRLLLATAEDLLHVVESPDVTALYPHPASVHEAYIARLDFPPVRRLVRGIRVTDIHFHLVLTAALFLATPRGLTRRRLANLGWALLATVVFDVLALAIDVEATYAARLGDWSLRHYGPWVRNLCGMAAHLLELPFRLALPFALWAGFHLRLLLGEPGNA